MSCPSVDQRVRWSLSIRPAVRATIGDHALWNDWLRVHADAPTVPGVVTHPSTVDPVIYSASVRTLGDSDAKMRHRGFYASAPTAETLSDHSVDGGTLTRSVTPELLRPVADTTGQWWRVDRVGTGHHHRDCARASGLTVDDAPMVTRPVTLATRRQWAAVLTVMGAPCDPAPVSLWAGVAALVGMMAGRPFTPAPLSDRTIIGATIRPVAADYTGVRPRADGRRPRRTDAQIMSEAATLLAAMLVDGLTPRNGRPSAPRQVAAVAYHQLGGIRPTGGDVSHVLASALRTIRQ